VQLPTLPAIVRGRVEHRRRTPIDHQLTFKTYFWLVDVDELPQATRFASFLASDHFGGNAQTLRASIEQFAVAKGQGINENDRLVMFASARSFGYVFNPLTAYWCISPDNIVRWLILEIHNTYGERHAHLIHVDERGSATFYKEFYVSPFLTIEGRYEVLAQITTNRIVITVNLLQQGKLVFNATFIGVPQPDMRITRIR
jgi:DUF1365 family protein